MLSRCTSVDTPHDAALDNGLLLKDGSDFSELVL